MSDIYGKVLARLWSDPEIRALSDRDFRIFVYLLTNEHRTISGVYRLPVVWAAHDLKARTEDVETALFHHLAAWVKYDPTTEEVWVRNLAAVNCDQRHNAPFGPTRAGKKEDSRLPALRRSLDGIRSAWLRSEWLHYYAAWGPMLGMEAPADRVDAPTLVLMRGVDAPSHAPSDPPSPGGGRGLDTPSTPIAVAVAGSNSSSSTVPNGTGRPVGEPEPVSLRSQAGLLMGVVRAHLYGDDGKPPEGYDDGRDYGILLRLLESGVPASTLEAGIEGVAMMRDAGEFERWTPRIPRHAKMTMRMLYNTRHGVVQLLEQAEAWYFKHDQPKGKRGAPSAIGAVMAGMGR